MIYAKADVEDVWFPLGQIIWSISLKGRIGGSHTLFSARPTLNEKGEITSIEVKAVNAQAEMPEMKAIFVPLRRPKKFVIEVREE